MSVNEGVATALHEATDEQLLAEQARRGQRMPWDMSPNDYAQYRNELNRLVADEAARNALLRAADELDRLTAERGSTAPRYRTRFLADAEWLRKRAKENYAFGGSDV